MGLCPARRRVWFAGVGDPSGEADGLAVAVTGIALRILIFFGVADGEGWGVGLLPTNMRWKSDAFLGFGVGETEAEGDAFARITLGLGVPAGDADASGDAEGVGLAWTIGRCLGFGDGVGVGVPVDSVSVDDVAAAEMGTDHLIARGYRRIAIRTGPLHLANEMRRVEGYRRSLARAGLAAVEEGADALLCTNGPAALAALRALRDRGLKTPRDIGFVTFDELTVEDLFQPAITTVVQPAYEIGRRAAGILLDRIEGVAPAEGAITVRLPAVLKIRESSRSV